MNLRSANPYWLSHTPLLYTYSSLQKNIDTEVAVVGSGISGALVAYQLARAGHEVVIITKGHVGEASTCASTSLLQYEIDTPLHKLIDKVGLNSATRSYLWCNDSIAALQKIHQELKIEKAFQNRKSLLLASTKKDVGDLEKEYEERIKIGLQVDWLTNEKVSEKFGLNAPAALYSSSGAQTDAYLLTQSLVQYCHKLGAGVFDKTEIKTIKCLPKKVELNTANGYTIKAKHVVMASGYETVNWIDRNFTRLHSTYVIISEPVKSNQLWKDKCLIWETARPYIYMRTTPDNRIIIGGKDEPFASANIRDSLIKKKSKQLLAAFKKKFPQIPFNIEYSWAGTFAETRDGLPFIGSLTEMPGIYFALGFGGNGITFSQIAAEIITAKINGGKLTGSQLFSFDRKNNT